MLTPISVQEGIAAGHRQTHQQTHKIVGGGVVPRIHAAMDCGAKTMQNSKFEIFLIVDVLRYGSTVFGWYASRSQAQTVKVKVPMPPQTKGTHSPTLSSTSASGSADAKAAARQTTQTQHIYHDLEPFASFKPQLSQIELHFRWMSESGALMICEVGWVYLPAVIRVERHVACGLDLTRNV